MRNSSCIVNGEKDFRNMEIHKLENSTLVIAKKVIELPKSKLLLAFDEGTYFENQKLFLGEETVKYDRTPSGILIVK